MEGLSLVLTPIANSPVLSAVVGVYLSAMLAVTLGKYIQTSDPTGQMAFLGPQEIMEIAKRSAAMGYFGIPGQAAALASLQGDK